MTLCACKGRAPSSSHADMKTKGIPEGPASSRDLLRTELFPLSSAAGRLPLSALALSLPLVKALLVDCVMLLMRMFTGSVVICCPSAWPHHMLSEQDHRRVASSGGCLQQFCLMEECKCTWRCCVVVCNIGFWGFAYNSCTTRAQAAPANGG